MGDSDSGFESGSMLGSRPLVERWWQADLSGHPLGQLGLGNWTFFGSDRGGKAAAVSLSFIATCTAKFGASGLFHQLPVTSGQLSLRILFGVSALPLSRRALLSRAR